MHTSLTSYIEKITSLLLVILFALASDLSAQPPWFVCNYDNVTNCNSEVPSIFVDLRGYPSSKWYSCGQDRGTVNDTCCAMTQIFSDERCVEFKVLLDPEAEGFLFELVDVNNDLEWNGPPDGSGDKDAPGAPNISDSGNFDSLEYRLNCDPNRYVAFDPICIDDLPGGWTMEDTLFITFCMTGASDNVYRIKSLKAEIDDEILIDCETTAVEECSGLQM
ncbi:MAG: hypothetical protein OEQ53_14145, partial [Saprospiraceae bacterium]|nr:hypothetical protein [Saprospiraceae bacterium]